MALARRLDAAPVTLAEWETWPEQNTPLEVVKGYAIASPSPTARHQRGVARLLVALSRGAPPEYEVLPSPLDWLLTEAPLTVRQPDITVVTRAQAGGKRLTEPPLLAVEVVSPGSQETDRVAKREEYAAAGLPWYWLVDLDAPQIVVLRLVDGRYEPVATATGAEALSVERPLPVTLRPADLR